MPDICYVPGCERISDTSGLCKAHYMRFRRFGDVRASVPLPPLDLTVCSIQGCGRVAHAKGMCKSHHSRLLRRGDSAADVPLGYIPPLEERFWSKVNKLPGEDACWIWTGACCGREPHRYGQLSVDGDLTKATHVAWFLETGKWPELQLLHKCDNPPCVRFKHLFEGTQLENIADMKAKRRSAWKATDEQVSEIRSLYASGLFSQNQLSRIFGLTQSHVGAIIRRKERVL